MCQHAEPRRQKGVAREIRLRCRKEKHSHPVGEQQLLGESGHKAQQSGTGLFHGNRTLKLTALCVTVGHRRPQDQTGIEQHVQEKVAPVPLRRDHATPDISTISHALQRKKCQPQRKKHGAV